jgi:GTP cyclohydrolase IA
VNLVHPCALRRETLQEQGGQGVIGALETTGHRGFFQCGLTRRDAVEHGGAHHVGQDARLLHAQRQVAEDVFAVGTHLEQARVAGAQRLHLDVRLFLVVAAGRIVVGAQHARFGASIEHVVHGQLAHQLGARDALQQDVKAPIREALVVHDAPHAAHAGNTADGRVVARVVAADDAHVHVAGEHLLRHLAVTRLEHVQRQQRMRKEHRVRQREDGEGGERSLELPIAGVPTMHKLTLPTVSNSTHETSAPRASSSGCGIETVRSFDGDAFEAAVRALVAACGIDADVSTHMGQTAARVRALWEKRLLGGYGQNLADVLGNGFADPREDVVVIRGISVHGVCPHHLVPFRGVAHVAYLPGGRLHGFGRIARLVDAIAHRFTYQEWLTRDVVDALLTHGKAKGAACVVEAEQLCLLLGEDRRGDERVVTQAFGGVYESDVSARAEVARLVAR